MSSKAINKLSVILVTVAALYFLSSLSHAEGSSETKQSTGAQAESRPSIEAQRKQENKKSASTNVMAKLATHLAAHPTHSEAINSRHAIDCNLTIEF